MNLFALQPPLIKGLILSQLAALGGAIFFVFYKQGSSYTTPLLAAYALFVFALLGSIPMVIRQVRRLSLSHFSRSNVLLLLLVAGTSLIGNVSIVVALEHMLPSSAHLLQRSETLFTVLVGLVFLHEKNGFILSIAALLFCFGIITLHYDSLSLSLASWLPIFAALSSALSFSIMQAASKNLLSTFNAHVVNVLRLLVLVAVMSATAPDLPIQLIALQAPELAAFALAAFIGPVLARVAYMNAAYHAGIARAALFASVSPLFTIVLQYFILGHSISALQGLGSLLLLMAVSLPLMTMWQGR